MIRVVICDNEELGGPVDYDTSVRGGNIHAAQRTARRLVRVASGLLRPSTRPKYLALARQRIGEASGRIPLETCPVCEARAAKVVIVTDTTPPARGHGKTFRVRICQVCGHVANPENTHDYRQYDQLDSLTQGGRIGTPEREGREYHMARMALDILGRDRCEVLIYGAGRSFDNHHIAALPQVRHVAIADVMRLRDDAEFIDANLPAPRRFAVVVASEVIEHFLDPRRDFARLLDYLEPDGLLVCGTNIYDGSNLAKQPYLYVNGHTSYYSPGSLARLAAANGHLVDFRVPLVATGYGGPRKRYVLFSRSDEVMAATARYFETHRYAPSESPTANLDLAAARQAAATRQAAASAAGADGPD